MTAALELPDYDIKALLGRGGMANVYLARHTRLNRLVAVKVMHADLAASDSRFSERFLREARIAADLNHPCLAQVYDGNRFGDLHYIAMEYASGGDLQSRLQAYVSHEELLSIIEQVAAGLDFAHARGYVHRDIKPGNVLFRESGEALITDFGISKVLNATSEMTEVGSVMGTPTYISPEQATGQSVDGRSDLYSVAVMVYQILTGKPPYLGDTGITVAIKHVGEPIPRLPPPLHALQPFIDKGMAKNPEQRFQHGAELVAMLRERLALLEPADIAAAKGLVLVNLADLAEPETVPVAKVPPAAADVPRVSPVPPSAPPAPTGSPAIERSAEATVAAFPLPRRLWPALVLVGVLLLFFAGLLLWDRAQQPTIKDQARVEILLRAAQADLDAGRYTRPAGGNALEKIQRALELVPDHSGALAALKQVQKTKKAHQTIANLHQTLLLAARSAALAGQWSLAVEGYLGIPEEQRRHVDVQREIVDLGRVLVDQGAALQQQRAYAEASEHLALARALLPALTPRSEARGALSARIDQFQQAATGQRESPSVRSVLSEADASRYLTESAELYAQALAVAPDSSEASAGLRAASAELLSVAEGKIERRQLSSAARALAVLEQSAVRSHLTGAQQGQLALLRSELNKLQEEEQRR